MGIKSIMKRSFTYQLNTTNTIVPYNYYNKGISYNMKWPEFMRESYILDKRMYNIIFGTLLGDGCLIKHIKFAYYKLKHSFYQLSYLIYCFNELKYICNSLPKIEYGKRNNTFTISIYFITRQLKCLNDLYNIWYKDGIKILPHISILYHSLNPIVLAYWIMDDGTYRGSGITIYTNSFKLSEVITLINILRYKYNIICNLHIDKRNQPNIYLTSQGLKTLIPLILPYIRPEMIYKLGL